jgi:hypothetical protein
MISSTRGFRGFRIKEHNPQGRIMVLIEKFKKSINKDIKDKDRSKECLIRKISLLIDIEKK